MRKEMKGAGKTAEKMTSGFKRGEFYIFWNEFSAAYRAAESEGFEKTIAGIERWAREQLDTLGLKYDETLRAPRIRIFGRDPLPIRIGKYAVQLLIYIRLTRMAIADNNAHEAARIAIAIGEFFTAIQISIQWEKFARRGKTIADSKRSLSRLYREAVAILESEGVDYATKRVLRALEEAGVIRVESGLLHWTDDNRRQQETLIKQFDTNLSRHRVRIR